MSTMPFGRFKGIALDEIPDGYIAWLLGRPDLREPLRSAVIAEATARGLLVDYAPTLHPARAIAEELIGAGLRTLARKHHPDVGGDLGKMQQVTAAASWLRGRLQEIAG